MQRTYVTHARRESDNSDHLLYCSRWQHDRLTLTGVKIKDLHFLSWYLCIIETAVDIRKEAES